MTRKFAEAAKQTESWSKIATLTSLRGREAYKRKFEQFNNRSVTDFLVLNHSTYQNDSLIETHSRGASDKRIGEEGHLSVPTDR